MVDERSTFGHAVTNSEAETDFLKNSSASGFNAAPRNVYVLFVEEIARYKRRGDVARVG